MAENNEIGVRSKEVDTARVLNTQGKMRKLFEDHNCIAVSLSGGSDSDIMLDLICKVCPDLLHKVRFIFADTGLEYNATRQHLTELEQKYGIKIERLRGMSVVTAVRKYGVPIVSKEHSHVISQYCRDVLSATPKVEGQKECRYSFTPSRRALAHAIKERGLKVSDTCCQKSKKDPLYKYMRDNGCDLNVTGERRAEGGLRATKHTSCFEKGNHGIDKYMPLFFWNDATKAWYKEREGIRYSDCYEVWGMKRTGCCGCPFNSKVHYDLELMKKYEPTLYKACLNVFGESYRLMDEFHIRKIPILEGLEDDTTK